MKKQFKLKLARIGNLEEFLVPKGCSIAEALAISGTTFNEEEKLYINKQEVVPQKWAETIINEEDALIVIVNPIRGEAPTPRIKTVRKHLSRKGFISSGGKGDHEKYTAPNGKVILLNPDKRDNKHLDLGSAKQLAKFFNLNLFELYEKLQ